MVRENLPTVPIEVIGGPSALDIMLTLAKISSKSKTISGRFSIDFWDNIIKYCIKQIITLSKIKRFFNTFHKFKENDKKFIHFRKNLWVRPKNNNRK